MEPVRAAKSPLYKRIVPTGSSKNNNNMLSFYCLTITPKEEHLCTIFNIPEKQVALIPWIRRPFSERNLLSCFTNASELNVYFHFKLLIIRFDILRSFFSNHPHDMT